MASEDESGLAKKVAAGVAVGLATTAAASVAKKLLGDDGGGGSSLHELTDKVSSAAKDAAGQVSGTARAAAAGAREQVRAATAGAAPPPQRTRTRSPRGGRTKEQLYADAKRLGIAGRSRMSKTQLERAVARRGRS